MQKEAQAIHPRAYVHGFQNKMQEDCLYYGQLPTIANIAGIYHEQMTTFHPFLFHLLQFDRMKLYQFQQYRLDAYLYTNNLLAKSSFPALLE